MDREINESIWMKRFNNSVYVVNVVIRVWSCGGEMSADAIQSIKLRAVSSTQGDCANVCTWSPSNLAPGCFGVFVSLISSLSSCCLWSTFSRSILDESRSGVNFSNFYWICSQVMSPVQRVTEIAGPETGGLWVIRPKERQVRSRKLTEQMSTLENAGPQNAGPEIMSMKWG